LTVLSTDDIARRAWARAASIYAERYRDIVGELELLTESLSGQTRSPARELGPGFGLPLDTIETVLVIHLTSAVNKSRIDEGACTSLAASGRLSVRRDLKVSGVVAIGHTVIIMVFVISLRLRARE
jgi:hypothetical protein